jgi:hypothetical protein
MSDLKAVMTNVSGELQNPASFSVTSTGSTTARSLANRFADVVNVKDFGAVGDGIADDAPAIRLALAYAMTKNSAEIVFPNGTYNLGTWSDGTSTFTGVGQKQILHFLNTSGQKKRFLFSGNGSTLVTGLYPSSTLRPPSASYGFALHLQGLMDVAIRDINFVSKWEGARGLIVEHEARTSNPWGILNAINARSYIANNLSDVANYIGQVENLYVDNCQFLDWTQSISCVRVGFLDISNSYFAATWGTASCGSADYDWTTCLAVSNADEVNVHGCKFIGCIKDDFNQIPEHTVVGNGTPRYRSMDNAILSKCLGKTVFVNNVVEKFAYEAVACGSNGGCVISNNIIDGKRPIGETSFAVFQSIRTDPFEFEIPATGSSSTNIISSNLATQLRNGDIVTFISKTGGSNISLNTNYYVVESNVNDPTKFKLSTTIQGSPLSLGSNITASVIRSANKLSGKQIISNNVINHGSIWVYGYVDSIISNNIIQLPSRSYLDGTRCVGIRLEPRQNSPQIDRNSVVENNYIFGTNIPTGSSNWDGTVGTSGTNPEISAGIEIAGDVRTKTFIKNNSLILYGKDNPAKVACAFILDAETVFENNYVEGWDFVYGNFGGGASRKVDRGLQTNNILKRLQAQGNNLANAPVFLEKSIFKFYPTATGWYRLRNNARRSSLNKITIGVSGDSAYGSYINGDNDNQRLQHTVFFIGGSGFNNSTDKNYTINQHSHTSTATPIVSKVRVGENAATNPIWIYVNAVTTRWELSFSGGGGTGAAGHVTSTNGVIDSLGVTITNSGSGYTSAPTVTIRNPSYNLSVDIQGSGATFTATLSGSTVGSVAVDSGGSGYASAINVFCESDFFDMQNPSVYSIESSTPSNDGIELTFQQGVKSISRVGGTSGARTGYGEPVVASTAPSLNATYSTPEFIGQQYINTSTGIAYLAAGTSSSADWKAISFWEP